jgi:hypothetical protein
MFPVFSYSAAQSRHAPFDQAYQRKHDTARGMQSANQERTGSQKRMVSLQPSHDRLLSGEDRIPDKYIRLRQQYLCGCCLHVRPRTRHACGGSQRYPWAGVEISLQKPVRPRLGSRAWKFQGRYLTRHTSTIFIGF